MCTRIKKLCGKCKNERGCPNLVQAVSHYHVGMESRFALATLNLLVNQEFK